MAEVAAATGFTRQAVYRAVRDGRLSRYVVKDGKGHTRLLPEAVAAIRSGMLRLRVDTHQPPAPAPAANPGELWGSVAAWANALLDLPSWGPPPWTGDQWATLSAVIEQADDLEAEHGVFSAELLAQLDAQ